MRKNLPHIARVLLEWYAVHRRNLPWRLSREPYLIWVSEIILQQTRVQQGLPYYQRFVGSFPDVASLAGAGEKEVLQLWQGLGYYSRARNMLQAAQQVMDEMEGAFPSDYRNLLRLKGVGEYTAAAVASIAGGEPVAVVDGNVIRVVSRLAGMDGDPGSKIFRQKIRLWMEEAMVGLVPGDFNQAVMEFGALQCLPRNPICGNCPLQKYCRAYQEKRTDQLPSPKTRKAARERHLNFLVISQLEEPGFYVFRKDNSIWKGLYLFPFLETPSELAHHELPATLARELKLDFRDFLLEKTYTDLVHILTHQRILGRFFRLSLREPFHHPRFPGLHYIKASQGSSVPMPRMMHKYLEGQ